MRADSIVQSRARAILGALITAPPPVELRPQHPPAARLAASDWPSGSPEAQGIPLEIPLPRVFGPGPPRMRLYTKICLVSGGMQIIAQARK